MDGGCVIGDRGVELAAVLGVAADLVGRVEPLIALPLDQAFVSPGLVAAGGPMLQLEEHGRRRIVMGAEQDDVAPGG